MDLTHNGEPQPGPHTLAIDVGGSGLKAGLLDPAGRLIGGPRRTDTPANATPDAVVSALRDLTHELLGYERISVGFPGVVRRGTVLTAPNLGTDAWRHFPLAAVLTEQLGRPTRMLNDADVQGLGAIKGSGTECVMTLGTGMGFAIFQDGMPTPHLELAHHPMHKNKTYEDVLGDAALKKHGRKRWNKRLRQAIDCITALVNYDALYIGGGNSRHVDPELADTINIVSNEAGITGGVRLWDPALDHAFLPAG